MTDERWRRIEAAVQAALDLPHEARRAALAAALADDSSELDEACSLLDACESSGSFLDTPAPRLGDAQTPDEPMTPSTIGPYAIGDLVGEGGMGSVFLAEQREPIRRRVALKLIRLGMNSREVVARFEAERQALALMDHPCIARVYDAGAAPDGRPYFAMEYVPGSPITKFCDQARLGPTERMRLFVQVCEAVQHAHQKGVIHRDLKPSNVLVADAGGKPTPKIIDFGVAKATAQPLTEQTLFTERGQLVGTPEYMSPEQAGAGAVDTRTDVYSLGVLLYELLVGALPFDPKALRAAGFAEIQRRIRDDEPPRPSTRLSSFGDGGRAAAAQRGVEVAHLLRELRGDIDWIILRAMEKSPSRRYASASELAADMLRHLQGEAVVARPPTAAYRAAKFVRRNRAAVFGATAVGVALVLGAAGSAWQAVAASSERDRARGAEFAAQHALAEAEEQAAIAGAINQFLNQDLISAASPDRLGRDVTVREAMDAAASAIDERFPDQPRVEAAVRTSLGFTYLELGEIAVSIEQLERALERFDQAGVEGDLGVALAKHVLARAYWQQGRNDEAEAMTLEALHLREELLGPDHPQTSATRNNLGTVLFARGEYAASAIVFGQIYESLVAQEGAESRRAMIALANQANALQWGGDLEGAVTILERLLAVRTELFGRDYPDTVRTLGQLGGVLRDLQRNEEALAAHEESLALHRDVFGADHPATGTAHNDLALVLDDLGRRDEAESHYRRALEVAIDRRGLAHPYTLTVRANLAVLLGETGRLEESYTEFEATYELSREALPEGNPTRANAAVEYGVRLRDDGDLERAASLIREGYDGYAATLGPSHTRTRSVARSLASVYALLGDEEQAGQWIERSRAPGEE